MQTTLNKVFQLLFEGKGIFRKLYDVTFFRIIEKINPSQGGDLTDSGRGVVALYYRHETKNIKFELKIHIYLKIPSSSMLIQIK